MAFEPDKLTVYCDTSSDAMLIRSLVPLSEPLRQVSPDNIKILPRGAPQMLSELPRRLATLTIEERPDFSFVYDGEPVLVVELTEHGYTGDNPLQRFTRCAGAAEQRIPYVYVTPFSRVRDDEMGAGRIAVKRNVNTDVFKGMSILSNTFEVPQIAIDWPLGLNGKPRKISHDAPISDRRIVFGELVEAIDELVVRRAENVRNGVDVRGAGYVERSQDAVKQLWTVSNRREPTTRYLLISAQTPKARILAALCNRG